MNLAKQDNVVHLREVSLDELFSEACCLGRVSLSQGICDNDFTAEIKFENRRGSIIYAKGKDKIAVFALDSAIKEARDLGAGDDRTD